MTHPIDEQTLDFVRCQNPTPEDRLRQALAALNVAEEKATNGLAWTWAYLAADEASHAGITGARDLLGPGRRPDTEALRACLQAALDQLSLPAWAVALVELARRGRTGVADPETGTKLNRERAELLAALHAGDPIDAAMEAGDCAYYLAKAVANHLITSAEADAELTYLAGLAGFTPDQVVAAAGIKFALRSAPGHPKQPGVEKAAVSAYLFGTILHKPHAAIDITLDGVDRLRS